jgi:uncharacterized membrane protein YccC
MNAPAADAASPLRDAIGALRQELLEIELGNARGQHCGRTAIAVGVAVIAALALRVDAPWWAAISAFVSMQVTAPSSIQRGFLRIAGTAIGAAAGLFLGPWLIEDQVAVSFALFAASAIGVLGLQVSRHGYAWLLGAVTVDMVLLAALDDPTSALSVACNRSAEVTIGTVAAILVSLVLSPRAEMPVPPAAPGWSDLFGAQWPSMQHALRAGFGVMLVPWVWSWLELPNLSQTAVTVAAVMAVQAVSEDEVTNRQKVATRATHRILGCLIGGLAGLALLGLSFESFLPWLLALIVGVWIGAYVQNSTRGIGYVGTQGTVVFIMTLVQGWGPPSSIMPGIERFAGITGGLLIVLAVSVLTTPSRTKNADASRHIGP